MLHELFCQGANGKDRKFKKIEFSDFKKKFRDNKDIDKARETIPNVVFISGRVVALNMSNGK